ncbi:hypothetical protein F2P81_002042 [Scophthalmus maximus]|uniref:Zyxin n=1 Tax=Scophthalmus maximus TaxID=52904 RepID=A0A6A4THR7_SCOMX|nr:hypothetical protein F2P81_002042 [Scophthalmus maximus]
MASKRITDPGTNKHKKMEDSNSSKPFMVTSSLNFKVTTPSFYNQPKKFASVAPPRPKSLTPPSAPSPTPVGTGVIGRVGDLPLLPPMLCDDFPPPPPPPPPLDDDLPAPPPECHTLPTASDVPPPAFPAPPPVAEDLPLPAPPEESVCPPTCPSPPPPPPPPPLPASSASIPSAAVNPQRLMEKQSSFDQQLDCLTDLLSEMETRGPFNPKLPSKYSSAPAPKPSAPPPTAPKPALSFLPPPEMADRPPPAPWAEELKARTNRQANHNSAQNAAAQPFSKAPAVAPKSGFGGRTANSSVSLAQKLNQNLNQKPTPVSAAPKPSPPFASSSIPPPPAAPPAPPAPPNSMVAAPASNHIKSSPFASQVNVNQNPPAAVPLPQPKTIASPPSSFNQPMKTPPASTGMQFYDRDGAPQCEDCYMSSLAVCSRCGERITDRVLKAVGQCFHSHCFRCSTCSCVLEGAPFITDDNNNPYCVQDYHRRFSPLCVSCNEPIIPAPGSEETVRVVALDKNFHLKCYRCEDCARPLSIEADENGCYPLDVTQCLSPACQRASARLSMSADPFMEPCDYFLFTCDRLARDSRGRQRGQGIPGHPQNQNGKSRRPESRGENKEREDRGLRGGERLDRKTVLLQYLREILESNNREGGSAVQKAKGFYHSCLDTKTIETAGVEPFLTLIQKTIRPFLATCQRYLALLGALPSSSMIHVGMFMSLSSELAVAATPLQYRLSRGQLFQRMSIKELQIQAPAIDWLGCLRAAFHPLHLIEDDHVLLHNLPYMVHMSPIIGKWLNKHEPSNSGPLQTYMVLNLLHTLMPALDSRFSETVMNVSVGNADVTAPRWKRCVLETERGFDSVLTHLLRERTAHREAEEIIQNIFSSFKSKLHELKWRDQKSLQSVMTKVSVGTHGFFSNYVQLLSLWQKRRRKLLTEQIESADILSVTPLLLRNELLFPMGMFVPPLFHPTYPRAMNYGVMGFLMAKDILHLLLPDIYSRSETVHAVGECVWAHYLTVTENAGRGGAFSLSAAQRQEVWVQYSALQIALQAYHQSLKSSPADTSISGFSHTRLFLSSFSQVNCDFDPYNEFMPLEPSFLITVICAKSHLCPTSLQCPSKTQQHSLQTC